MRFLLPLIFILSACAGPARRPSAEDPKTFVETFPGGSFTARVRWTVDPETLNDVLHGALSFIPSPANAACPKIGFVQVAKVSTEDGSPYRWPLGESPRNEQATEAGFFVDHRAATCAKKQKGCSPDFADHWPNDGGSAFGKVTETNTETAKLEDYPFGWTEFRRIELEACAVCDKSGEVYGCLRWGGEWPATGSRRVLKIRARATPSESFQKALEKFRRYYGIE